MGTPESEGGGHAAGSIVRLRFRLVMPSMSVVPRRSSSWRLASVIPAIAALALALGALPAAAQNPSVLSKIAAAHLVQSTGNLYWTANQPAEEFGDPRNSASVWRASKSSTPGDERLLWRERRTVFFFFGALTYAKVQGTWYGYFAATYGQPPNVVSRIKRVPLAGGQATTIATSPSPVRHRDLVTDGRYLFWVDEQGLRRMAVGGGAIRTLITGELRDFIALSATRVFYSTGRAVRSVPKADGTVMTHAVGATKITAIHARRTPNGSTFLLWGQENGEVRGRLLGGPEGAVQAAILRYVKSVSSIGPRVLWIDCGLGQHQSGTCTTRKLEGVTTTVVSDGGVGSKDVQGDAAAMYWSQSTGIMKFVH